MCIIQQFLAKLKTVSRPFQKLLEIQGGNEKKKKNNKITKFIRLLSN